MNDALSAEPSTNGSIPLREDFRLALFFGFLGTLATAALFPYLLQVTPQLLAKLPASIPLPVLIVAQSIQAGLLMSLLAFLGLRMSHSTGLDAPWLRAIFSGRERPRLPWLSTIIIGLSAGFLVIALDQAFASHMPAMLQALPTVAPSSSAGAGFLASFYGGIGEEVELRLFFMTLLVWLASFFTKKIHAGHFWFAIVAAALLFGALHLPAAAQIWPLDSVVIARTIILNTVAGIAFGWLYWKRGFETAMLAHFCADLVLHVVAPLISP